MSTMLAIGRPNSLAHGSCSIPQKAVLRGSPFSGSADSGSKSAVLPFEDRFAHPLDLGRSR